MTDDAVAQYRHQLLLTLGSQQGGTDCPRRVREILHNLPTLRCANVSQVARVLDISGHTLTRLLSKADISFRELVDRERRRRHARGLIIGFSRELVMAELGYRHQSSLYRAKRRWELHSSALDK